MARPGIEPRTSDYESGALPTALRGPAQSKCAKKDQGNICVGRYAVKYKGVDSSFYKESQLINAKGKQNYLLCLF